jgi:quinol-cytochrome oxidoreductase complex cytochrome b subunit
MKKNFYPDYLIEILFFIMITFELIIVLSLLFPPLIGREIDFTSAYQPRPEWYYLWIFWLLRFFSTDRVFVGGVLIPFTLVAFLICIPWLDKKIGWITTAIIGLLFLLLFIIATLIEILLL